MLDIVVCSFKTSDLKFIPNPVPAHWRYWRLVGFAGIPSGKKTKVQVYGMPMSQFTVPVGVKKN